jgi:CheY-like chemotaxis protein
VKPLRVLVVEDEAIIAMLLATVLKGMGYDVCAIALSEAEAVSEAARCNPDLMIVDARLRDGDSGIAAVTEILRGGFIPHVFVTGDAFRVRAQRPDSVILQKPFGEAELARAITRAMSVAA